MKVNARVDLPTEITKDSVVAQLIADKQKLAGEVGRLQSKLDKLQGELAERKARDANIKAFYDKMRMIASEHLGLYEEYGL